MPCNRCGAKKIAPTAPPSLRTVRVSAPVTSKFSRISVMEPFTAETPMGNLDLIVGKTYIFPAAQVKELQDNGAPIWVLK